MTDELKHKIEQSIKLIQTTCKDRGVVEVAYSGGKDSDVILQLVKESGIPYRAIYKNTTIDPPYTIAHAKEMGAEIRQPEKSFLQLVAEKGFPHRSRRFCCKVLKEYKVLDTVVIGIRMDESTKRRKRYKEPTECRIYNKKKDIKSYIVYPILYWSKEDVAEFIADRKIKCHPLYYDENGKFHAECRLGCMGCPLMSRRKRVEFFKENPKWLKAWIRAHSKTRDLRETYERLTRDLLYDDLDKYNKAVHGLFPMDCEEVIKKTFNI